MRGAHRPTPTLIATEATQAATVIISSNTGNSEIFTFLCYAGTMQIFTRISGITQSKSYVLSLTAGVLDFQNNALWDTH